MLKRVLSTLGLALLSATLVAEQRTVARGGDSTEHWAFGALERPTVPDGHHPIDFLVEARLRERSFVAAGTADWRTIVRRLTYDLHGLPPTEAQLAKTPDAYASLVRELLASPRYGERWGRHWLDVARYSDAKDGVLMYGDQRIRPFAYTYRDWVIRAFNEDRPFDEFVRLQIAADQMGLPESSPDLAAMGLLTLGRMFDGNPHDVIDDQIDVVTRGFLGLTVSCARCHDHKFDPIPTTDYYSLYGVFASSVEPHDRPRIAPVESSGEAFEREISAKLRQIRSTSKSHYEATLRTARERTPDYLVHIVTTEPDVSETAIFFLSLIPEQLRPQITNRWRQLIARRATPGDPVFAPWHDLVGGASGQPAGLLRDPELWSAGSSHIARWRKLGVDERILDGLARARPTTIEDVARSYGEILRSAWAEEEDLRAELAGVRRRIRSIETSIVDLADVVAGGDGSGNGEARGGIHPVTGAPSLGGAGFITVARPDEFVPAPENPFVDGVVVPRSGSFVISSTGLRVTGIPSTSGKTWDHFKRGASEGATTSVIDGVDYSEAPHSLLALHANKAITFDLAALRQRYEIREARLRAVFGHGGAKGESRLDAFVLLDGRKQVELRDFPAQGKGHHIDLELPADSRFLTFIVVEGAQGISHDQAILGDARIVPPTGHELSPARRRALAEQREAERAINSRLSSLASEGRNQDDPLLDLLVSRGSPVWFPEDKIYYYLSRQQKDAFRGLLNQIDTISVRHPNAAARAMVLVDADTPTDPVVFERGDPTQRGRPVPRRFLQAVSNGHSPAFERGSGRLDLADAIVSTASALTARVWVNRIWLHHFGEALVDDPSDFGLRTPEPMHLDILDFLASELIEGGWRTKPIHELIVTSRTYRRASSVGDDSRLAGQIEKDPETELLWRARRRRLDLEQMRDTFLSVSGTLDPTMFGRPRSLDDPANLRRTIYAFVERQNQPNLVKIFDFANADTSTGRRVTTTVPQQALFSMNSSFVARAAKKLAERSGSGTEESRIRALYHFALGRAPSTEEVDLAVAFVAESSWEELAQVLLMTNELMFVD